MRALLLGLLAVGCSGGDVPEPEAGEESEVSVERPPPTGTVIARVGDGYVTQEEFASAAMREAAGQELGAEARNKIMEQLIAEELLVQEAVRRGHLRDPKVRRVLHSLVLKDKVYSSVRAKDFTNEQIDAYYEEHASEFERPDKVEVKRIFVRFGDKRTREEGKAIIDKAAAKIKKNPASFSDVAEQVSEGPNRRRGGTLGYVSEDGKPGVADEIVKKAFELPSGSLSEPFEAAGGWNLLVIGKRREGIERSASDLQGSILRRLKADRYEMLTNQFVEDLRKAADVTVDANALAKTPLGRTRRTKPTETSTESPGERQ